MYLTNRKTDISAVCDSKMQPQNDDTTVLFILFY